MMAPKVNSTIDSNNEQSPLLETRHDNDGSDGNNNGITLSKRNNDDKDPLQIIMTTGSATVTETIINLSKTCMGTGCLALPYAARQGGMFLFTFGTLAIALWNAYSVNLLCQCLDMLTMKKSKTTRKDNNNNNNNNNVDVEEQSDNDQSIIQKQDPPPAGTATLAKVAWYAIGPVGLTILDICTVLLFLGIVITYLDAIRSFLQDTPFSTGSNFIDSFCVATIMISMSIVPNLGPLSKASAFGLLVLGMSFVVIASFGIYNYQSQNNNNNEESSIIIIFSTLNWMPQDGIVGVSHWFGCTVFGFGVVPLTFNFRESMAEPTKMVNATVIALLIVATCYVVVGIGLLLLYPDITGDVLHEIPSDGIIPTLTRLSMVIVVLSTAPLLIVPCGEIIEGKLMHYTINTSHEYLQIMVRCAIGVLSVVVSVGIPGFVVVLSFVGCFCVAIVGFCIPPLLHLLLLFKTTTTTTTTTTTKTISSTKQMSHVIASSIMLIWGIIAAVISTIITFQKLLVTT